jgi:acetyltransferase-like isoleucine patch superfamily enzyme
VPLGKDVRLTRTVVIDTRMGGAGDAVLRTELALQHGVMIATYGGTIEIHSGVGIGPYTMIYRHGGVRIGAGTLIASHCVIVAANHVFADASRRIRDQGNTRVGVHIGADVWLGTRSTVLDGVTVGDGAVVAAGAVVTRDVEPYTVMPGVPARPVGKRS